VAGACKRHHTSPQLTVRTFRTFAQLLLQVKIGVEITNIRSVSPRFHLRSASSSYVQRCSFNLSTALEAGTREASTIFFFFWKCSCRQKQTRPDELACVRGGGDWRVKKAASPHVQSCRGWWTAIRMISYPFSLSVVPLHTITT